MIRLECDRCHKIIESHNYTADFDNNFTNVKLMKRPQYDEVLFVGFLCGDCQKDFVDRFMCECDE